MREEEMQTSAVVPNSTELKRPNSLDRAFSALYGTRREGLLRLLRQLPSVMDLREKLVAGKSYYAVIKPELQKRLKEGTASWDRRSDGSLAPIIREAGKGKRGEILGQISLKEVNPELLASVNQLALQNALADIIHRLEIIDEKLDRVLVGLQDDRLAKIDSGIQLYEQACGHADALSRTTVLGGSIQHLSEGRASLMREVKGQLTRVKSPGPLEKIASLLYPNHTRTAQDIHSTYQAILRGSYVLAACHDACNAPQAVVTSLKPLEEFVREHGARAAELGRWLPYDATAPPEELWSRGLAALQDRAGGVERRLTQLEEQVIEVEFIASDLTWGANR